MQKKSTVEIQKEKIDKIDKIFDKAVPFLKKKQELEKIKNNSSVKKICIAILSYLNGNYKSSCITIYNHFHVNPRRRKDTVITNKIKENLKEIREGSYKRISDSAVQAKLFV